MRDLVIVGSGPAGLSAAVYAKRAMMEVVVLEKMEKVDLVNSHLISLNISLFPSVNKLGLYG